MPTIIITSPHAIGNPAFHYRDEVALYAARILANILQRRKNIRVIALEGDMPRNVCDLNRSAPCDPTDFKKRYIDALRQASFVIDVHSFPNEHLWQAGKQVTAAFLYDSAYRSVATALARHVTKTGLGPAIAIPGAPGINFVIYRATLGGVPNVLVEINESLSESLINRLLETIVAFIVDESLHFKSSAIVWTI